MSKRNYHFIGIGGIGMSTLAKIMLNKGQQVSGSDIQESKITKELKQLGAEIYIGHNPQNVNGADTVIYSSAIRKDNPEILEAETRNLPVLKRANLLAQLMGDHISITVAGAHGKTTTASMISHLLMTAKLNPTTAIGGNVAGPCYNANLGGGKYFIAEVDESDGTFLNFFPHYSVITNIDSEHMDYYNTFDNVTKAYEKFIKQTKKDGCAIVCGDDLVLYDLIDNSGCEHFSYGLKKFNNLTAKNIELNGFTSRCDCVIDNKSIGRIMLNVPGQHNILNALACAALGLKLGIGFDVISQSLREYKGVKRRFQIKGDTNDILIVDDYGHHPTEIEATLKTAQSLNRKRIVTVFQPHRYTRTKQLMDEFAQSLSLSDVIILTDIYAASEKPIEGVTSQKLLEKIKDKHKGTALYLKREDIVEQLKKDVMPGDLVLTLGAGNIYLIAEEFKKVLEKKKAVA